MDDEKSMLLSMPLHTVIVIKNKIAKTDAMESFRVTRVVGGWIYRSINGYVFVPEAS